VALPSAQSAINQGISKLFFYIVLLAAAISLSACRREQPGRPAPPPAEVEIYPVKRMTIPVTYEFVGSTEASQAVDVRARVQGVVWEQGFEEGTSVTAGQFLFRIDPRPFEADLQIAEAQAFQAKVAVQSAERDLNRTRTLSQSDSVAREELDDAMSLYETNMAALRLAEAQLVKSRLELSYTTVTAPVRGMVGRASKRVGDLVDAGTNSLLVTITTQNPMWVNFSVAEKDLLTQRNDIEAGRILAPSNDEYDVNIILLDGTRYSETGRINFADVEIDSRTGTGQIRAEFKNPDGLLKPGMFVEVLLSGARRTETVVVPQNAVMQGMQGTYVYVVGDDNVIEMRPVTPSEWEGENWIIESGLENDDRVVINGTNKTAPGAEVKVTTVTTTLDFDGEPAVSE